LALYTTLLENELAREVMYSINQSVYLVTKIRCSIIYIICLFVLWIILPPDGLIVQSLI